MTNNQNQQTTNYTKIYVDIAKTYGTNFVFYKATDWTDFNDKTKILGTKIIAFVDNENNDPKQIVVKIKKPKNEIEDLASIQSFTKISFINLQGQAYYMNNKLGASLTADDLALEFIR